jgi:paraquat-inducible protein A
MIACHECDLLQREVPLPAGGVARCPRCGAEQYRSRPDSLERTLAFTLGAIVLFTVANAFPIIGLKLEGQIIHTTLYHTVRILWNEEEKLLASLVFMTTILMPALELCAMAYLLLPLKLGRAPRHFGLVFRALRAAGPWDMVEVLMLGVLVSLVKLAKLATVVPGIALWSLTALMLLYAAIASSFDPRELWARRSALR